MMRVHASAVAFGPRGVLIQGASGSGKSSLALQLIRMGATLISDDQTELYLQNDTLWGRAPDTIAGLIEARGLGLLHADAAPAPICAAVDLDTIETERLPPQRSIKLLDREVPQLHKVESPAWPAALAQYLISGRSDPE
ncbi:HPr kinase/phosphatase C-terminal domain-containing protein [uncultured Tateyamaria sp.]|uniref:HPr kinase/phosphorylase n=1 Tax=Tateyamaria sp. 1078 TaxID=3417464 RepID=UPI0026315ECD|nr:HPr kinase/phosphatase C-terminal domain-containing protein [uncultured Tateyamaria sp.]